MKSYNHTSNIMHCTNTLFFTELQQKCLTPAVVTEVLNNVIEVKEEMKLKIKFASSPTFAKSDK